MDISYVCCNWFRHKLWHLIDNSEICKWLKAHQNMAEYKDCLLFKTSERKHYSLVMCYYLDCVSIKYLSTLVCECLLIYTSLSPIALVDIQSANTYWYFMFCNTCLKSVPITLELSIFYVITWNVYSLVIDSWTVYSVHVFISTCTYVCLLALEMSRFWSLVLELSILYSVHVFINTCTI